jgi:hypothetical protein
MNLIFFGDLDLGIPKERIDLMQDESREEVTQNVEDEILSTNINLDEAEMMINSLQNPIKKYERLEQKEFRKRNSIQKGE